MRIGIVGAGRIGGGAARMFARAGHEVLVSGSRDPADLQPLADEIGGRAGTPREAVEFGEVVLFAVPWRAVGRTWAAARRPSSTRSGCGARATRSRSTP